MDIPLLVIIVLLSITLVAFFSGVIPYPIGWIVLSAFLLARLLQLSNRQ
jgi:dihydroxy-acid dehydratase